MKMKKLVLACAGCFMAATACAKLSDSVPDGWVEDFAAAKEEAMKDGKLLLMAFSGSDWCGWCKKMEKAVYSKKEFIDEAKKKFVLLMIDSPRDKDILTKLAQKQNPQLVKKYKIDGYPTTIIALADGTEITRASGARTDIGRFLGWLASAAAKAGGAKAAAEAAAKVVAKAVAAEAAAAAKDDRFFHAAAERAKISAREQMQRRANATNDFELATFAGIKFGAGKADGAPELDGPYLLLSKVAKTVYTGGKLSSVTLAAPAKDVRAMSTEELRSETCKLVRAIEKDLGIRFAVTGSRIDFAGRKAAIEVKSGKTTGLSVQFTKKK